jgi:hypothetical protein
MDQPPARSVVLDSAAQDAVDAACDIWEGAETAWLAIEWTLSRDPKAGSPLRESGDLRAFVYVGARSIKQPDVRVIYQIAPDLIVIKDAVFTEAKAMSAGLA